MNRSDLSILSQQIIGLNVNSRQRNRTNLNTKAVNNRLLAVTFQANKLNQISAIPTEKLPHIKLGLNAIDTINLHALL